MMRGIAAMSVVICHTGMFGRGTFGVDLFFCISGFIMMLVTEKSCHNFLKKRFLRICPIYYMLTIAAFSMALIAPGLLRTPTANPFDLLRSFLFIGGEDKIVVGVGWTLCYEMMFYVLFFIAFKINHARRHIIATILLALPVVAGFIINCENDYFKFYTRPQILEFALGMMAFKILNPKNPATAPRNATYLLIPAVVLYASLFFLEPLLVNYLKYVIPVFTFIPFVLTARALQNRKMPRFLVMLGNTSYSMYLTHTFILTAFSRLVFDIDHAITPASLAASLLVTGIVVGVSYLSWYLIEQKFTNWLKVKLKI